MHFVRLLDLTIHALGLGDLWNPVLGVFMMLHEILPWHMWWIMEPLCKLSAEMGTKLLVTLL